MSSRQRDDARPSKRFVDVPTPRKAFPCVKKKTLRLANDPGYQSMSGDARIAFVRTRWKRHSGHLSEQASGERCDVGAKVVRSRWRAECRDGGGFPYGCGRSVGRGMTSSSGAARDVPSMLRDILLSRLRSTASRVEAINETVLLYL